MRRKDREVNDVSEILSIVERCEVLRLGLTDGTQPYVLPLNFGHCYEDGRLTLYFHGATQGKKIDMIRANPRACFEMDINCQIVRHTEAVRWTSTYESVIGFGELHLIEDEAEKKRALDAIMHHLGYEGDPAYPPGALAKTQLIRFDVESFTGKRNI